MLTETREEAPELKEASSFDHLSAVRRSSPTNATVAPGTAVCISRAHGFTRGDSVAGQKVRARPRRVGPPPLLFVPCCKSSDLGVDVIESDNYACSLAVVLSVSKNPRLPDA